MATSRVDGVKATLGRRVGTFRFFLLDLDGPVAQEEVEDVPPVLVAVGPVVLVGAEESENVMRARRHTREVIDALRLRIVSRLGDALPRALLGEAVVGNINSGGLLEAVDVPVVSARSCIGIGNGKNLAVDVDVLTDDEVARRERSSRFMLALRPFQVSPAHVACAERRGLDAVRIGPKSKEKPPSAFSDRDDARRWREGTTGRRFAPEFFIFGSSIPKDASSGK